MSQYPCKYNNTPNDRQIYDYYNYSSINITININKATMHPTNIYSKEHLALGQDQRYFSSIFGQDHFHTVRGLRQTILTYTMLIRSRGLCRDSAWDRGAPSGQRACSSTILSSRRCRDDVKMSNNCCSAVNCNNRRKNCPGKSFF